MFERFTEQARRCVVHAQEEARTRKHKYMGTEHILLGLLSEKENVAYEILSAAVDDVGQIREIVTEMVPDGNQTVESHIPFTPRAKKTLETALREALQMGHSYIGTEHILLGLSRMNEGVGSDILLRIGLDPQTLRDIVVETIKDGQGEVADRGGKSSAERKDSAASAKTSKLLEQFGQNLTKKAEENKLDPVIGREKEIERLMQILARRTKNNPVLIGEPGVGKTAVVEGLAERIAVQDVPEMLKDVQVYTFDLSSIVAGSRYRGDFEEKMKKVLKEVEANPKIILFIDELHTIMGAGAAEGSIDAANILKPVLARGEIRVIGATTLDEYRKHVEKDPAMERRFQPVRVEEPTVEQAIMILQGLRDRYESHHKVAYTDAALESAARMSQRYVADRFLPDKAIDLVDEAAAKLRTEIDSQPAELDEANRRLMQLEIERQALKKEKDTASKDRLAKLEKELAETKEKATASGLWSKSSVRSPSHSETW